MSILIYSKMTVASVAADSGNTAGKGVITLGSAIAPYLSAAAAGGSDQQTLSYVISQGSRVQACRGVYSANGGTLTRATTYLSTAGTGANEVFDSGAVVTFCVLPADVPQSAADLVNLLGYTPVNPGAANTFTQAQQINAALGVTGSLTAGNLASTGNVTITGAGGGVTLTYNSAPVNAKTWIMTSNGNGDLIFHCPKDDNSGTNFAMTFNRSGNVPTMATLLTPLNLSNNQISNFNGAFGGNTGTAFQIGADPYGTSNSKGGYCQFYGGTSQALFVFGAGGQGIQFNGSNLSPQSDNAITVGDGSHRPQQYYAVNGNISTSDEREKLLVDTGLVDGDTGLLTAMGMRVWRKVRVRTFQWKDAVALKGADKARWHVGLLAQELEDALNDEEPGLAERCGMFCEDLLFETVMEPTAVSRAKVVDGVTQMQPVYAKDDAGEVIYDQVPGDVLMDGEPTREVRMVGDVPTLVEVPQPRMEERPVETPDGQEVEGLTVMVQVRGPSKSVPRVIGQEPVMEEVMEPQAVQKPVMVDGVQATRKGLRRDQTDLFYDAGLETLIAEQDARLTALEAKAS